MAFVNEYISDDDMEKYKIIDMYKEFDPLWNKYDEINMQGHYSWTIDKERNIYFIPVQSGRYEDSDQTLCALWWDKVLLSVKIIKVGGNVNYNDRKGSIVWDLVDIRKPSNCVISNLAIVDVLKDALVVYQSGGIRSPMKEFSVSFKF